MSKKKIFTTIFILSLCFLPSCGEWLDVQPKTSVEEEDLFSDEYGFKDALTGFYLKMGKTDLYAQTLTYYYMDMLAGLYESAPDIYTWADIYSYDGTYETTVEEIYSSLYNVIANINNFLKFVDQNREVITTEHYYETMKGEALGLRAFLHFDLLRLYGPIYKDDPDSKSIPYRTSFDNVATPRLPASEILDLVIADLLEAEELLDGHDSEIFDYDDSADSFTEMRQMRMNLWAVRAMLARVYCYRGSDEDKALALNYALSVIESGHFTLSAYDNITVAPILPTEQIFSLYIDDYYEIVDEVFINASASNVLSAYEDTVRTWYEEDESDARYKTFRRVTDGSDYKRVSQKYYQSYYSSTRDTYSGLNSQPLIRLPEMYYIAAECEPDAQTALAYLYNVITSRTGRYNTMSSTGFDLTDSRYIYGIQTGQTVRTNELMKEYLKEFYGEGQLFFFYKRFGFTTFSNCPVSEMGEDQYRMPLPNDEYTFGNNN